MALSHQALTWINTYYVMVTHFGDIMAPADFTWSLICQSVLQITIVYIVQARLNSEWHRGQLLHPAGVLHFPDLYPDAQVVAGGTSRPPPARGSGDGIRGRRALGSRSQRWYERNRIQRAISTNMAPGICHIGRGESTDA
jgi:hypothetical protein